MRFVITSDCFDGKTHRKKGEIVSYDDEKIISQMRSAGRLAEVTGEDARRIESEVASQTAREKRAKREPWLRSHKLQVAAIVVVVITFIVGLIVSASRATKNTPNTAVGAQSTNSAPRTSP